MTKCKLEPATRNLPLSCRRSTPRAGLPTSITTTAPSASFRSIALTVAHKITPPRSCLALAPDTRSSRKTSRVESLIANFKDLVDTPWILRVDDDECPSKEVLDWIRSN